MRLPLLSGLLLGSALAIGGCAADATSSAPSDDTTEDDLTATKVAGAYQHWGLDKKQGEITQLLLRPDKTFFLDLKGEFGCDVYAGFTCPSSWSDGRTGDTEIRGTWKATTKGLVLQPTGEGRPSAAIPMTLTVTKTTAKVEGTIVPNRRIFGELDVVGLFGNPHAVSEADLDGDWTFTTAPDKDGDQPRLDGTNLYVGKTLGKEYEHFVTFRGASKSYLEDRVEPGKKTRRRKDDGHYMVAGSPDGKAGPGVLVLDDGFMFEHVVIKSFGNGKVAFEVDPGNSSRTLSAEKK